MGLRSGYLGAPTCQMVQRLYPPVVRSPRDSDRYHSLFPDLLKKRKETRTPGFRCNTKLDCAHNSLVTAVEGNTILAQKTLDEGCDNGGLVGCPRPSSPTARSHFKVGIEFPDFPLSVFRKKKKQCREKLSLQLWREGCCISSQPRKAARKIYAIEKRRLGRPGGTG